MFSCIERERGRDGLRACVCMILYSSTSSSAVLPVYQARVDKNGANSTATAIYTVKTQIEEKCARTLEFPFSATRGENTANSAPS